MANMTPAGNVQAAAIAAFISPIIEHICSANGIVIPPDASAALPGAVTVLVAYLADVFFTPSASGSAEPGGQAQPPLRT